MEGAAVRPQRGGDGPKGGIGPVMAGISCYDGAHCRHEGQGVAIPWRGPPLRPTAQESGNGTTLQGASRSRGCERPCSTQDAKLDKLCPEIGRHL